MFKPVTKQLLCVNRMPLPTDILSEIKSYAYPVLTECVKKQNALVHQDLKRMQLFEMLGASGPYTIICYSTRVLYKINVCSTCGNYRNTLNKKALCCC